MSLPPYAYHHTSTVLYVPGHYPLRVRTYARCTSTSLPPYVYAHTRREYRARRRQYQARHRKIY
eukprot:1278364-Rhodomonas_salina.1